MDFDKTTEIELDQLERWFKLFLQKNYTPFLGLQKRLFKPEVRKKISETLQDRYDPLSSYLAYLTNWPAVFISYLTLYVAEGFGDLDTFAVYPYIEKALSIDNLTLSQKERLWEGFRRYCIRLGLSVSPRRSGANYMVEEYLRQAGVPLKYVADLTEKMLRFANAVGLPEDDDPSAIRLWQQSLCERLAVPFPKTVRKAVEADDTGYYVRVFLKLIDAPVEDSSIEDFESLMSKAIHVQENRARDISKKKGLGVGISQVIWREQQLGVELPPGEGIAWKIITGDVAEDVRGMIESRFVPFNQILPANVTIEQGGGRLKREITLWEDGRNNRLLIFSSEGVFVKSARLGTEEQASLEPGSYQLLMRFLPDGMADEPEEIHVDPALYSMSVFLEPGQQLKISRGPAELTFIADSKPLLVWQGESVRGIRGNELFCSEGTRLKAIIPSEMLDGESNFLVRLTSANLGQNVEIPVDRSHAGHLDIDISEVCKQWQPGVTRMLAEIQRQDMQRAVARSAIYLWNGLERVDNRTKFHVKAFPFNLSQDESDNLLVDNTNSFLTYRNDDIRFFRMVFNLGDCKRLIFTSAVPGIFMQLKDYSDSHLDERSIKKGTTLPVAWNSRSVLEIFAATNGTLVLGDFRKKVDFSSCGCKRLPLSGLVEYLGPMSDTLLFIDDSGMVDELVHLVSPHEVLSFSVSKMSNQYRVNFSMAQESSAISMTVTEILSGERETLILNCNRAFERSDSGANGWLVCDLDPVRRIYNHELRINLDTWPNGAWILDLEANIHDRWGGFSNARGDDYISGIIVIDGTICLGPTCLNKKLAALDLHEKLEILGRIHDKLLRCYALESWDEIKWLETLWNTLLAEYDGKEEFAPQLISLAEQTAPEGASCSWVPMLSISARFPWLYAMPARSLRSIPHKSQSLLIKSLTTMGNIKYGLLSMIKDAVLHQFFAFGFANVMQMMRGEEPKKFNMKTYEDALKSQDLSERLRLLRDEDWQPGDGDYLGPLHYLYVSEKLQQSYRDSLAGNDHRRGKAQYLCRSLHHWPINGLPEHLGNGKSYLHFLGSNQNEELSVEQESLLQISQYLSLFARACRWEIREKGSLDKFINKSRQIVAENSQFESILGYLLYIGRDIFSFYLLLWEAVLTADYHSGGNHHYVRK